MNKKNTKMNTKRILISFLVIASVLFLASAVSAYTISGDYSNLAIKVDGETVNSASDLPNFVAGDTLTVKVSFKYIGTEEDNIKVKATIEGESKDVTAVTSLDVETNGVYSRTLTLKVPSDFDSDSLTGDFPLIVRIGDEDVTLGDLHAQRVSYDIAIKSVSTSNSVEAGQLVPVEIVLKNVGYNDLDDLYVTAKIAGLGVEKTSYFGDLVTLDQECNEDCDEDNTVKGTLYLQVPYNVKAGTYTLEVKAENDDTDSIVSKEIAVVNGVPDLAMKSGNDLVLLNPTTQLKVYKVTYQDKQVSVIVPAASSKTVTIETPATGDYNFDVLVLSGDALLSTVNFSGTAQPTNQLTSPVLVLTVILAIVFLVLLVVLVVLITRKPQKTEEFGESYY
jgi:hypothetical protein